MSRKHRSLTIRRGYRAAGNMPWVTARCPTQPHRHPVGLLYRRGMRRMRACHMLDWETIPARIIAGVETIAGEPI